MEKVKKEKSFLQEWVSSTIIAIILALIIKFFILEFVVVEGNSMYPTLENNDRLIVTKFQYYFKDPEFQDIIILNYNEDFEFVKRIIGLPGDTIEIKNSVVYRNGQPIEEEYISTEAYGDFEEVTVPEDSYFVLGDNRKNSRDSRSEDVGFVHLDHIIGKVVFRIFPFNKAQVIK